MPTIAIRLDPGKLANPDLDIRYMLPDLLSERSAGLIEDDGYDYVGKALFLVLFLRTDEVDRALECIVDVIENVPVLDNDLRAGTVVAVEEDGKHKVVFPPEFEGEFLLEGTGG